MIGGCSGGLLYAMLYVCTSTQGSLVVFADCEGALAYSVQCRFFIVPAALGSVPTPNSTCFLCCKICTSLKSTRKAPGFPCGISAFSTWRSAIGLYTIASSWDTAGMWECCCFSLGGPILYSNIMHTTEPEVFYVLPYGAAAQFSSGKDSMAIRKEKKKLQPIQSIAVGMGQVGLCLQIYKTLPELVWSSVMAVCIGP